MPHKLWKISARFSKRCGVQPRKLMRGASTPDRARVNLTWRPDIWWHGADIFTQGVLFNYSQVLKNVGAARHLFPAIHEKQMGGILCPPPPPPVRMLEFGRISFYLKQTQSLREGHVPRGPPLGYKRGGPFFYQDRKMNRSISVISLLSPTNILQSLLLQKPSLHGPQHTAK